MIIKRSTFEIEGEMASSTMSVQAVCMSHGRHCPHCGSLLTTEADVTPDMMFVKAGGIDRNGRRLTAQSFLSPNDA